MEKLTNIIEAILFASGDAVPIDFLREKLEVNKRQMDSAIAQLEKRYNGDCEFFGGCHNIFSPFIGFVINQASLL